MNKTTSMTANHRSNNITEKSSDRKSFILKLCIFATGLAGIVAEYVLSTLASYLVGNPIIQWTLVISLMLFAMGVGSRISRLIYNNLLESLILIEFGISFFCSISAASSYFLSIYLQSIDIIIYSFSFIIGLFIGMEIPLVTRMNDHYEELRLNIANVMEKDYFGALVGGVFFAFFALPYLGLTYTPIFLGLINFFIASILIIKFHNILKYKGSLVALFFITLACIVALSFFIEPIILYSEQKYYKDTIIYQEQSQYQKIVITEWRGNYWLFLNGNEQFSTFDEERYHEPLVHMGMGLLKQRENILILGGGDGLAARELLKYPEVKTITLVDLDPAMTALASTFPVLTSVNEYSLLNPKVKVINEDAYQFLKDHTEFYDFVIIDLPDPKTLDLANLYSMEFYQLVKKHLSPHGLMVTQATSPIYANQAFLCINKTIQAAGFTTIPYHTSIPTMGEWGWVLAAPAAIPANEIKEGLLKIDFETIPTRFINADAVISMIHFGKGVFNHEEELEINTKFNPVLFRYYRNGLWDVY